MFQSKQSVNCSWNEINKWFLKHVRKRPARPEKDGLRRHQAQGLGYFSVRFVAECKAEKFKEKKIKPTNPTPLQNQIPTPQITQFANVLNNVMGLFRIEKCKWFL